MSRWRNGKRTAARGHRDSKAQARRAVLATIQSEPDDDSTDGWLKNRAALRACGAHSTHHPGRGPGRTGFEDRVGK